MSTRAEKLERRRRRKAKRVAQRLDARRGSPDPDAIQASDESSDFCFTISDEIEAGSDGGFELIEAADGENKPPGFEMKAYTGGLLDLPNYYRPVVVDLSGMTGPRRATPILRDHQIGRIVGHGRARITPEGIAVEKGRFSGGGDDSDEVLQAARAGFPWQASIGARPLEMRYVDKGEKVQVNGRTFTGPIYVARKSQLKEVSFVAIGADRGGASATLTAKSQTQGSADMGFSAWLKAKGLVEADLNAATIASLKAMYEAEMQAAGDGGTSGGDAGEGNAGGAAPAAPPVQAAAAPAAGDINAAGGDGANGTPDWLTARRRQAADEERRIERITAIAKQEGVDTIKINASGEFDPNGTEVPFRSHAIEAGWSPQDAELAALRSGRPAESQSGSGGANRIQAGNRDVLEAAVCLSLGLPTEITANGSTENLIAAHLPQAQREQVINQAMEASFRNFGISALMDEVIIANGGHYRGQRGTDSFIKAAMQAERQMILASGASTISLSGILSNVANKLMLSSYQAQDTTWRSFCAVGSNSNFKAHTRYRLTENGSFKKVGADGELKHVSLSEDSYSTQLETYGMMIALNRQMMINDDLGAFAELPTFIGRLAAIRVEEAVYVLLLSNPGSFFHADNGNLTSGAGSALSVTSLSTIKQKSRDQVSSNGKPIFSPLKTLLIGTPLEDTGFRLLESELLLEAATAGSPAGDKNPHKGTLKPVVSPYLNNTAITDQDGAAISGQSDTQWFSFRDPAVVAAMRVAFLNGRQVPTIESSDAEFETLGMKWRGFLDFDAAMEDPTAAQKSVGA